MFWSTLAGGLAITSSTYSAPMMLSVRTGPTGLTLAAASDGGKPLPVMKRRDCDRVLLESLLAICQREQMATSQCGARVVVECQHTKFETFYTAR